MATILKSKLKSSNEKKKNNSKIDIASKIKLVL